MKRILALAAATAMALTPLAASAQNWHRHGDQRYDYRHGDGRRDYPDYRSYERQRYEGGYRYRDGYSYRGPSRYYRGAYLPPAYRTGGYVVYDYGRYGYRAPPPGYRYYRTDTGEVVLAAIATGIISAIIADALID